MRFHHQTHPPFGSRGENPRQGELGAGVQVSFRLFHVNELTRLGRVQCHQYRQGLRHTHTDVGDVDSVLRSGRRHIREAPDLKFDLHVINAGCAYSASQS